jgi:PAS domain S-box-containing protein
MATAESDYALFFQGAAMPLCIIDFDGQLQRCNPAWETYLGIPPARLQDLLGSADAALFAQALAHFREMRSPYVFHARLPQDKRLWRWDMALAAADRLSLILTPLPTETIVPPAGNPPTCQYERCAHALNAARVGIWDWDLLSHDIYLSPEIKALLGYRDSELANSADAWHGLMHPDDLQTWLTEVRAYLRQPAPSLEVERRMLHKDGNLRWLLTRATVVSDKQSKPVRLLGLDIDISARKSAGACLNEQQQLLQGVAATVELLAATDSNHESTLQSALEHLGKAAKVDRIYIYEYSATDPDKSLAPKLRCIWSSEILSGKRRDPERRDPVNRILPAFWRRRLSLGESVIVQAHAQESGEVKDYLEAQGVQGILLLPLLVDGQLQGLIGFDECFSARTWTPHQIELLKIAAASIRANIARDIADLGGKHTLQRLYALIEAMPVILLAFDSHGRLTFARGKYLHSLGLHGDHWQHEKNTDVCINVDHQLHADLPRALAGETFSSIVTLNGRMFEARYSPWALPPNLVPLDDAAESGCTIVLVDITNRLRMEQALQEEARRNQMILETSMDGFCVIGMDGHILEINPAFCESLGYRREELLYLNLAHLEVRENEYGISHYIAETLRLGSQRFQTRLRNRHGLAIDMEISSNFVSFSDAEGDGLFFAFARDIGDYKRVESELRQAKEEAEAANRAKSDFLAAMSHEIRTPMNGLLGIADLLQYTSLTQQQQHYLNIMRHSGEALLKVINDILDYSKIEAGKLELELIDFNLRNLFEEISSLFAPQAHAKDLELIYHLPAGLCTSLRGDPNRLRQVLSNLLGNAIKFSDKGEIMLLCAPAPLAPNSEEKNRVTLHFEVIDTGIGITKEAQARLFQPFSQADSSMARRYGGTGLGLIICQRLVRMMGGEIGLNSRPGQGTTFWLNIPFTRASGEIPYTLPEISKLKGRRILVVDNNTTCREILRDKLRLHGMQVQLATDTGQAWQTLQKAEARGEHFDVLVLDLYLGKNCGLELWRRFQNEGLSPPPTVLLVPLGRIIPGAQDTPLPPVQIAKPIRESELLEGLLSALDSKTLNTAVVPPPTLFPLNPPTPNGKSRWRVLLAEDNAINQAVVRGMLEQMDCAATLAMNGAEALALLKQQDFDLVLMDCHMPEMDGFAATRAIRAWEAESKDKRHIPIIALTANAMQGDRETCLAVGMDDYLSKPAKSQDLQAMLGRWLDDASSPFAADKKPLPAATKAKAPIHNDASTDADANQNDDAPVIDRSVLARLRREQGGGDIGWLIDLFLGELPGYIRAMEQCYAAGDAKALYLAAHKCKGSSANLGAAALISLCKQIEILCKAGKLPEAGPLVMRLDAHSKRLKEALEKEKNAEQSG